MSRPSILAAFPRLSPLALALLGAAGSSQVPIDLSTWTAESYAGTPVGAWTVAPGGASVTQEVNGVPTVFFSDFGAFGTTLEGRLLASAGDNDFGGFVLGFEPGDAANPSADYLLVDWKGATQAYDFGSPSCTPGSTALGGLAVSRVAGIPTQDELWGHLDFDAPACSPLGQGVVELARAAHLGAVGWVPGKSYAFRIESTPASLKVYVDGVLELDLAGSFPSGRAGFYAFSQRITFDSFTLDSPAAATTYGAGWPGTLGVPALQASAPPVIGTTIHVHVGNAAGATMPGLLLVSSAPDSIPTAFGGTLLVAAPLSIALALDAIPPLGANLAYAIPNDVTLCGTELFGQLLHLDVGASGSVAFSAGLRLRHGT